MADKGIVYIQEKNPEIIEESKKLDHLAKETNTVIYEVSSSFPFQLFPDKIIINENKITIIRKDFLFKRVYPILIEDILTVRVDRGILFSSLVLEVNKFINISGPITHLKHSEAITARQYIIGLVQVRKEKIDLSKLTINELREKLKEIGKAEE